MSPLLPDPCPPEQEGPGGEERKRLQLFQLKRLQWMGEGSGWVASLGWPRAVEPPPLLSSQRSRVSCGKWPSVSGQASASGPGADPPAWPSPRPCLPLYLSEVTWAQESLRCHPGA